MDENEIKMALEALIFTSKVPLSLEMLKELLAPHALDKKTITYLLEEIEFDYQGRGIQLKKTASGYRFQTVESVKHWVMKLFEEKPTKYSNALLETLAIIAYKQPVTRAEIEDIRGVSVSSPMIKTLLEREWIKACGHKDVPGKPVVYGTTKVFLDYFNLDSLDALPIPEEVDV